MKRMWCTGLLAALSLFALAPAATAQGRCLEGRTASGACVNPGLADTMRQNAIIFSQQALSYTAYPVLPTGDRLYRYPNELIPNPLKPAATTTTTPRVGPH